MGVVCPPASVGLGDAGTSKGLGRSCPLGPGFGVRSMGLSELGHSLIMLGTFSEVK